MTTPNIKELIDRLYDWYTTSAEQNRLDIQKAADLLQSQAERIAELESLNELAVKQAETLVKQRDTLRAELDTLRAELEAIAAAEPEIAMIDAAMVEMANIYPPLKRSECQRLIRAALYHAEPAKPQDHEIRELVDRLTAITKEYGQTQQLRERIAQEIRPFTFTKPAQDVNAGLVELREWRDKAFEAHPNLDLDIEALSKYKGAK